MLGGGGGLTLCGQIHKNANISQCSLEALASRIKGSMGLPELLEGTWAILKEKNRNHV